MRKKVLEALRSQMATALAGRFDSFADVTENASSDGHAVFLLRQLHGFSFFASVIANDDSDSFRINFAWSRTGNYPQQPFRDLRASLREFEGKVEGEFQLALLAPGEIPWVWHLDSAFADWKNRLDRAMVDVGAVFNESEHSRLLASMPKKASVTSTVSNIPRVVGEVLEALGKHAYESMNRVAAGAATPSDA